MKAVHAAVLFALAVSACAPAAKAPPSQPVPPRPPMVEARAAAPPLPTALAPKNWMDAAQTPGAWEYRRVPNGGLATFAADTSYGVLLQCLADEGIVRLGVSVTGSEQRQVRILTETTERMLTAPPRSGGGEGARVAMIAIAPDDPLLDAMALSKGRFAVVVAGQAPLYLPSWAEVSRVIEDCR